MSNTASPLRVHAVVTRLQNVYPDLIVGVRILPRQGMYITVSLPGSDDMGLLFHVDQLDNGASGFRDPALAKINAFRDQVAYEAPPAKPGLTYDDVMTHDGDIS